MKDCFVPINSQTTQQLALPARSGVVVQEEVKKPKVKVVWQKLMKVYYPKSTFAALLPLVKFIGNNDVFKFHSAKTEKRNLLRLLLVDVWEGEGHPYPDNDEISRLLKEANFERSDIVEISVIAKLLQEENILVGKGEYFILSTKDYLSVAGGAVKLFPSIVGVNREFKLGVTFGIDINQYHTLILAIQEV